MAISRRGFLGGAASFGAFAVPVVRAAEKLERPLLRLGIVTDSHCRLPHDPAAKKTWGYWTTKTLQDAFEKFRDWGVDAVVHAGDWTEYGTVKELEASGAAWKRAFPGDAGMDGKKVEKLFVRGNHDKMGGRKGTPETELIRHNPAKAWKDVFGVDWYTTPVMLRRVAGVTFVLSDWGVTEKDLDDFFTEHAGDIPKDKPFFYIQHAPPKGTVDTAQDGFASACGGDSCRCARWLKKYPNAVALTGHSHFSVTLGDQTWQDDFLSIGCGCLQYIWNRKGRDNSWFLPKGGRGHAVRCGSRGRQGLYLKLFADRLVLERWDFDNLEKLGPDHIFPLDGTKPYSYAEQKKRARAPQFPKGAEITVGERDFHYRAPGEKWTDEKQVILTVPRAEACAYDEGRVYEYECEVFDSAEKDAKPFLVRRLLAANYFLNDARVEKQTIIAFGKDEMPADKKVRFAVRPMDCWGNRGRPIFAECAG